MIKSIIRSYSNVEVSIPVGKNLHPDHQATLDIVVKVVKDIGKTIPIYQYKLHHALVEKADLKMKLSPEIFET